MEFVYAYTDLEEYTTDTSRSESPTNNNSTPEIFYHIEQYIFSIQFIQY